MQTLHKRLDQQKEAVLDYTEKFGRSMAMDRFKVKDYKCFSDWLKDVTGNANFGIPPKFSPNGSKTLGDQLVDAVIQRVLDLKAENKRLREENEYLKWLLTSSKTREEMQALAIMEVCQD